jgi:pyridoxine/pyridoxamine 5'-phosphate oxidase
MTGQPTLHEFQEEAFRRLSGGVADRASAFHAPALVTISPEGAPEARTMVLRGFDGERRTLRLHTDARSGKIGSLARDPRCQVFGYDAAAKLQLRLNGIATVHDLDTLAEDAWAASRASSRMCYAAPDAPGTPVAAPPAASRDAVAGRRNFRALIVRFHSLEFLELAAAGHRRARFVWRDGAMAEATWLAP